MIWKKQNLGQKRDNGLMQVEYDAMDQFYATLDGQLTRRTN
jgi:hypothetical protein